MGVLGQGTVVVDGQRTTAPPSAAFVPTVYGQQTTGVPNLTPIVPPFANGAGASASAVSAGYNSVNGYGTADNNAAATSIAAANPFSVKVSPVWWAIGALVGGVLVLQAVNWHETVEEHAGKDGARVSAEAG